MVLGIAAVGSGANSCLNKMHYVNAYGNVLCRTGVRGSLYGDTWYDSIEDAQKALVDEQPHTCMRCLPMTKQNITMRLGWNLK